jgi:hypothetical protein
MGKSNYLRGKVDKITTNRKGEVTVIIHPIDDKGEDPERGVTFSGEQLTEPLIDEFKRAQNTSSEVDVEYDEKGIVISVSVL